MLFRRGVEFNDYPNNWSMKKSQLLIYSTWQSMQQDLDYAPTAE